MTGIKVSMVDGTTLEFKHTASNQHALEELGYKGQIILEVVEDENAR
jgi:hypothetical protein